MKKKKYLDIFIDWSNDENKYTGLCDALESNGISIGELEEIFKPTREEFGLALFDFLYDVDDFYWAKTGDYAHSPAFGYKINGPQNLTYLRQNILLFMAAMNEEL